MWRFFREMFKMYSSQVSCVAALPAKQMAWYFLNSSLMSVFVGRIPFILLYRNGKLMENHSYSQLSLAISHYFLGIDNLNSVMCEVAFNDFVVIMYIIGFPFLGQNKQNITIFIATYFCQSNEWSPAVIWVCFRWAISVIRSIIVLKLAVTVFTSPYFQTLWPNWLNFFQSFKKVQSVTEKNLGCNKHNEKNIHCLAISF